MFCTHCGAEVAEEERFCPFCGEKLSLEEEKEEPLGKDETAVLGESDREDEKAAVSDTPAVDDTVVIAALPSEAGQEAPSASLAGEDMSGLSVFVNPNPSAASGAGETQEFIPVGNQEMNASIAGGASGIGAAGSQGSGEFAPKKPRNIVAVAIAAVAAVLLLVGVGFFTLGGSADAAEVSVVTRIIPKDESGNALKDYTAQIEAEDGSRYQMRVQGPEGFTYADFGKIPYGPYMLVIINKNGDTYGPYETTYIEDTDKNPKPKPWDPIGDPTGKGGNDAAGKIGKVVKKTEDDEDRERTIDRNIEELRKASYAAYYEKCQEYMALTDGTVGEERYYEDLQNEAVWCVGLNMVDLVDFNEDGIEELVVVYYDESTGPEEKADYEAWKENYAVEVWEYRDNELVNIYQGGLPYGPNPATIVFSYCSWGEGKEAVPGLYFQGYDENSSTTSLWKYRDGALAAVNQFDYSYDSEGGYSYFVNGEEVSEGEYESAYDEAFAQLSNTPMRTLFLNDRNVSDASDEDDSDDMSYSSVREMTMENIDILREAAGVSEEEVVVSESSDELDVVPDYEVGEEGPFEYSVADCAGEYGFVEAEGMWLDLSIGAPGEDTWLLCWHDPEMASDADFTFVMEDGVTSYTVTDNRNTSGETEYQFDFVFGDGWVDVTITRIYDEYEIVPEGTFTFYKE